LKPVIPYSEFYITNVCNLNCEQCNRFNNYHFTGHQKWADYAEEYKQWAEKVELNYITILGGEPLLNPDVNNWIKGISDIWPCSPIEITTNGTRLLHAKKLYETLVGRKAFLHIGVHNKDKFDEMISTVLEFLDEIKVHQRVIPDDINDTWKRDYNRVRRSGWPDCNTFEDFDALNEDIKRICKSRYHLDVESFLMFHCPIQIIDINDVKVELHLENIFYHNAIDFNGKNFTVHNSDPTVAHNACNSKLCHHFIKGKLYKCNVAGVLPEFAKQFAFSLTAEDENIMHSYVPLTIDANTEEVQDFISNLSNEISMCKFCPEKPDSFNLNPNTQKIKIGKIKK